MPTARMPGLLRHGPDGSEAAGPSTHSGPQVPLPLLSSLFRDRRTQFWWRQQLVPPGTERWAWKTG